MDTWMMNRSGLARVAVGIAMLAGLCLACSDPPTSTGAPTYPVGGMVTGLMGSGLVLRNNGGDDLSVTANGPVVFATPLASGASYSVTVLTQPTSPGQTCIVASGRGTVTHADVTSIGIFCAPNTYTVGGTVSGLVGTGLVLRNNGGDDLAVSSNGTVTFPSSLSSGAAYGVTVFQQPTSPAQSCEVNGGSGTVATANVTNVAITCATNPNTYTVGGTVSGMVGSGLVLQNNGGDDLSVTANGSFTFANPVASGSAYSVTVFAQPTSPAQNCAVTNGNGTVAAPNITTVAIACTTGTPQLYAVGGTISGLTGSGLILRNNGVDDLPVSANGSFTFATPLATDAAYSVTVFAQPTSPAQSCVVTNGNGTVAAANITTVAIVCSTGTPQLYAVGGTVSGLTGSGLILRNNGGDDLAVSANGTFSFATPLASGAAYSVTVFAQPASPAQSCAVTNGNGTVAAANITTVAIACTTGTPQLYVVGGTVSGLTGSGLILRNNGVDDLPVSANGTFAFATPLSTGAAYSVTVLAQPTNPAQTCVVTGGSGTVVTAHITNVAIACTRNTNTYTVGGRVSGLAGSGLVLRDNGGDDLAVSANGLFTFTTGLAIGTAYRVTVFTQPSSPAQTCTLTGGSGTITASAVTTVMVACATNGATIGAFVYTVNLGDGNVSAYTSDPLTGALTGVPGSPFAAGQYLGFLSVVPSGRYLYGTNSPGNNLGSVTAYRVDHSSGALTAVASTSVGAGTRFVIAPGGKFAYAIWNTLPSSSPLSGTYTAYTIDAASGTLTAVARGNIGRYLLSITIAPSGKFAYVTRGDWNSGRPIPGNLSAYTVDATTGALTPLGGTLPTGTFPGPLAITQSGEFGNIHSSSGIWAYTIEVTTGQLNAVVGNPFPFNSRFTGGATAPGGRFAYVADPAVNAVAIYTIDATTGALTPTAGGSVPAGTTPFSLTVDPSGRFLYVANYGSNDITVYSIDPASGALTPVVGSPFATGVGPWSIAVVSP